MDKRSQAVKRASVAEELGEKDTAVTAFLKWLAGKVAEKLIAREPVKKPSKNRQ